jgi:hypothetical protein
MLFVRAAESGCLTKVSLLCDIAAHNGSKAALIKTREQARARRTHTETKARRKLLPVIAELEMKIARSAAAR